MPGQDTAAFDAILKDVYEGGIRDLLPTKTKTLDRFEAKDAKEWGGRVVTYPAKVGRNQGAGWGTEGGALPAAQRVKTTPVRIPMRYMYGRITLTAQVMKASEGNRNAFASAMKVEMDDIIKSMQNQRGRTVLSDGRGVMCLINEASPTANAALIVDSPGGVAGATNGGRFLNPGDVIAVIVPATGQVASAGSVRTIQSISSDGTTLTLDSAPSGASIANNGFVVKAMHSTITDVADTSYQKEAMGLMGHIDDGTNVATYHNVNRTTYPIYQSTVISSVGALSADVIQRAIDLADQRGDGDITDLTMHHSVRRSYLAMMEGDRRYAGSDLSRPDAGTVAAKRGRLTFGGIGITEEKYAPYSTIFGSDNSGFSRYVEVAGEWIDEDGAILCRVGTGATATDTFEATYRLWDNFHNDYPATCFRLDGVTATVVVAHIE